MWGDHTHLYCICWMLLNTNTCLSNFSSCCKPLNTVIRWRKPRTHTSATSTFGATKSRLCLLRPWTTEKHTASSIAGFRPGDFLFFLLTVRSILLNVSVFQPLRTSTISSTRTAKKADKCQRAWLFHQNEKNVFSILQWREEKHLTKACHRYCASWKHWYGCWVTLTLAIGTLKLDVHLNERQNGQDVALKIKTLTYSQYWSCSKATCVRAHIAMFHSCGPICTSGGTTWIMNVFSIAQYHSWVFPKYLLQFYCGSR